MNRFARRIGIAVAAFALAWFAAAVAAIWLFGSGNILVWVLATLAGAIAYPAVPWWDARGAAQESR